MPRRLRLTCPASIVERSPDGQPVPVVWPAPAIRGGRAPFTIQYHPARGSLFPVGETRVDVTARSADNRMGTCFFPVVVVQDSIPAPSNLAATFIVGTQIDLTWQDVATNETGYEVQRKSGAGPFTTLVFLSPNSVSYSDTSGTLGSTYTYRVRAFRATTFSQFSNEDDATIPGTEVFDFYLSMTGNDAWNGLFPTFQGGFNGPKRNFNGVNGALLLLSAGKSLGVRGGTYLEAISRYITVCPSGTSWANKVRIANYGGETVWLQPSFGENVLRFGLTQQYIEIDGINLDGANISADIIKTTEGFAPDFCHHIRAQNAEVKGNMTDRGAFAPVAFIINAGGGDSGGAAGLQGGHEFRNLVMHHHGYNRFDQVWYPGVPNCVFENNEVYDMVGGIEPYNALLGRAAVHHLIIRNNRIHDGGVTTGPNGWSGNTAIIADCDDSLIYNNLAYNLQAAAFSNIGIWIWGNRNTIAFNTVANNPGSGFENGYEETSIATDNVFRNNISWNNSGGDNLSRHAAGTVQDHNLFGINPLFVGGNDFHLMDGSQAINNGVAIDGMTKDLDAVTRGDPPEIGCYEKA